MYSRAIFTLKIKLEGEAAAVQKSMWCKKQTGPGSGGAKKALVCTFLLSSLIYIMCASSKRVSGQGRQDGRVAELSPNPAACPPLWHCFSRRTTNYFSPLKLSQKHEKSITFKVIFFLVSLAFVFLFKMPHTKCSRSFRLPAIGSETPSSSYGRGAAQRPQAPAFRSIPIPIPRTSYLKFVCLFNGVCVSMCGAPLMFSLFLLSLSSRSTYVLFFIARLATIPQPQKISTFMYNLY